jgi:hypothetical protein
MKKRNLVAGGFLALLLAVAVSLVTPRPAEASIHEIIAALCRAGGEEVVPHGQNKDGQSFVRALQATGFITSIDTSDPTQVVIHFDPTVPNSKYMSAGFSLTIPNGAGLGVDLVLDPLVVPDPRFPAHANCANLR